MNKPKFEDLSTARQAGSIIWMFVLLGCFIGYTGLGIYHHDGYQMAWGVFFMVACDKYFNKYE